MTAEDLLRDRLRGAASSMPVGSGSLAGVQARAAQLQRRRNAVRGSVGAFALVAVAAIGVVSLRDGGIDEFSTTMADSGDAAEAAAVPAMTAAAAFGVATDDMAAEDDMADEAAADIVTAAAASDNESHQDESEMSQDAAAGGATPPARSDPEAAVFGTTVSIVKPPAEMEGADMSYSFSGGHALARAGGNWYAHDGADWKSLGSPGDMEVVAVDLSESGRIAVFGVVRPLECDRSQVVAVRTGDGWSYVRVDDDTPSAVGWDLLDARIRVTDTAVELERVEHLWLDERCADASLPETLTEPAARLVADLELLGEILRTSWPAALLDGGFAARWPDVASSDAHVAAASGADLDWIAASSPTYTTAAQPLPPSQPRDDGAVAVALHETTIMNVATTVHVSGGMAMLMRGDQMWEVCPIPDEELHQVHGQIGQAGEHLAVVVGKPDQTLFMVERTE